MKNDFLNIIPIRDRAASLFNEFSAKLTADSKWASFVAWINDNKDQDYVAEHIFNIKAAFAGLTDSGTRVITSEGLAAYLKVTGGSLVLSVGGADIPILTADADPEANPATGSGVAIFDGINRYVDTERLEMDLLDAMVLDQLNMELAAGAMNDVFDPSGVITRYVNRANPAVNGVIDALSAACATHNPAGVFQAIAAGYSAMNDVEQVDGEAFDQTAFDTQRTNGFLVGAWNIAFDAVSTIGGVLLAVGGIATKTAGLVLSGVAGAVKWIYSAVTDIAGPVITDSDDTLYGGANPELSEQVCTSMLLGFPSSYDPDLNVRIPASVFVSTPWAVMYCEQDASGNKRGRIGWRSGINARAIIPHDYSSAIVGGRILTPRSLSVGSDSVSHILEVIDNTFEVNTRPTLLTESGNQVQRVDWNYDGTTVSKANLSNFWHNIGWYSSMINFLTCTWLMDKIPQLAPGDANISFANLTSLMRSVVVRIGSDDVSLWDVAQFIVQLDENGVSNYPSWMSDTRGPALMSDALMAKLQSATFISSVYRSEFPSVYSTVLPGSWTPKYYPPETSPGSAVFGVAMLTVATAVVSVAAIAATSKLRKAVRRFNNRWQLKKEQAAEAYRLDPSSENADMLIKAQRKIARSGAVTNQLTSMLDSPLANMDETIKNEITNTDIIFLLRGGTPID